MRDDAIRIGKRFIGEFQRDDVAGLAAELAYRFLFAIFPFGIFVAALAAFIAGAVGLDDPTSQIMGSLGDNLPPDIANAIRPQLEAVLGEGRPGLLTVGAIGALWAATGGMNALIKAMNRAWEVEDTRAFLPKTALAIGLTLLASVGIVGSFVTVVGASLLTTQISTGIGLDRALVDVVSIVRWPLVFVLLSIAVAILYHLAPNFRAPWRWCFAGGALFAVAWSLTTCLFSLYVANFGTYANTYGALGGVIVLMLWFYLSALILVASAALMAAALKELQPANVHERRTERGTAGAGTQAGDDDSAAHDAGTGRAIDPGPPPRAVEPVGPRPARPRPARLRPLRATTYRMSPPEDWARAGVVAAIGAALGVVAAWLVSPRSRA
jgi:membrane protein